MPGTDDIDDVQIIALDDAIQMNVKHIEARRRAPVAEQARLDVFAKERLLQQGIVEQVNLPDR